MTFIIIIYDNYHIFEKLVLILHMKKVEATGDLCPEAQSFLKDLRKLLKDNDVLTSLDESALSLLGDVYHNYIQATKILRKHGLITESQRGDVRAHPAVKIQLDAQIQLTKLFDSFGLTPKSRKELLKAKEKDGKLSPMDVFLNSSKWKE